MLHCTVTAGAIQEGGETQEASGPADTRLSISTGSSRLMTLPNSRRRGARLRPAALALALLPLLALPAHASAAAPADASPAADDTADGERDARTLDRLEVTAQRADGYGARAADTATRLPLTLRETPQSVNVATRELMDDFQLDDINRVLDVTTGVNVERVETDRTYYTARGFEVTNFQVDGLGLPFSYGLLIGDVDTAFYDRIEVLRGANGLLTSTGNPSATINFVRKRPLREFGGEVALSFGSWDNRRLDADLSLPLNADGSVRSRFVLAAEDGDDYLDRHSNAKQAGYGIVEADLGDATTVAFGVQQQRNQADDVLWGALPLYYTDGSPTRYDRSTSTSADWSFWDTRDTRGFAELRQRLGDDWQLRVSLNHRKEWGDARLFYIYGTPDRETGLGLFSYPGHFRDDNDESYGDAYVTGPLRIGGREHEVVAGFNAGRRTTREDSAYATDQTGLPLPPLEEWQGDFPEPPFPDLVRSADFTVKRKTAYAMVRWHLGDATTLITGLNHTRVRGEGDSYGAAQAFEAHRSSPYFGLVQDLGEHVSAYASYARIFNPQTELDENAAVLAPIEGSNAEAGVKGEWYDGALNASLSVFRVEQQNTAEQAGYFPGTFDTYYRPVDATSKGWEGEVSGRLAPGWQVSAGYTRLFSIEGEDGEAVRTYVPRGMLRLSTTYQIPGVDGLRVGGYARWQDDIKYLTTSVSTSGQPIVIRQDAYAVLGLMGSYDFAGGWRASVNIDNLTDRKYLSSLYWEQAYYAAPRSVTVAFAYRF